MEITDAAYAARSVTALDILTFSFTSTLGNTFDETDLTTVSFGIDAPGNLFEGGFFFADIPGKTLRHIDPPTIDTIYAWDVSGEVGDLGTGQWVVPEPATASLLLLGLAGLAVRRQRS